MRPQKCFHSHIFSHFSPPFQPFDGVLFTGTVEGYKQGDPSKDNEDAKDLWHVRYEDDDAEDVYFVELQQMMDLVKESGGDKDKATDILNKKVASKLTTEDEVVEGGAFFVGKIVMKVRPKGISVT